jgi:cytoskeletal protein RodZ
MALLSRVLLKRPDGTFNRALPARTAKPAPQRNRPPRSTGRRKRPGRKRSWVVIFILVSLLAHLLLVLTIVLLNHFVPKPDLKSEPPALASTTISLQPTPPPAAPPPKHIFMPTEADAAATHKQTLIESAHDNRLRSQSTQARTSDSIMPDVVSHHRHAADLQNSPNAPSTQPPKPATASTQPSPPQQKSPPSPQASQQEVPQPNQAQKPTTEPQPEAKQTEPQPAKKPAPKIAQQQLDPNGLPVLPPLNAPTMAPASQRHETDPSSSLPAIAQDIHGAVGTHGDNSPEAMRTELGAYKAKVYAAVGARWYRKVDDHFQTLPVGMVHIQFTIHEDGTVDTKVLEGDEGTLQTLLSISLNSIREAAPFDPFTPSMIKEVGDSYTDDFTFSIYGGGE